MMISSSFSHWKWLLAVIVLAFTLLLGNRFFVADLLLQTEEQNFAHHLQTKDIDFFEKRLPNQESTTQFLQVLSDFEKIIEPKVVMVQNNIFFSFLALKKHSSRLYNYFAIVFSENGKTVFLFSPQLEAKIIKKDAKSLTIQNTSSVPLLLDGKLLAIPSDKAGIAMFTEKVLGVGQSVTIRFAEDITKDILFLENLSYGFRIHLVP